MKKLISSLVPILNLKMISLKYICVVKGKMAVEKVQSLQE